MEYNVEVVADYACACGEGPLWHPDEKKLYWVDIPKGRLFRYDPETGNHEQVLEQGQIGGFTIQEDGSFILFMQKGRIARWNGSDELEIIIEHIPEAENGRFNDVAADPEGRVFCGTLLSGEKGCLYRLDTDGSLECLVKEVGCANGIGFTPDRTKMYFTDSTTKTIYLFDYNRETGEIFNQRDFIKTPEGEGVPDGMTVDADGNIWSARWDGFGIFKYSPEGELLDKIELPTGKTSSVIFAGDDYTDMYVTSAGGGDKETNGESAGALFRITGDFQGVPEFKSKVQ